MNVYRFLNMHIFLLCKCTIYESISFIIIHITVPSSTTNTISNKMPGPGRRKRNNNRAVQSNRKNGRRPRLATKAPEAPEAPEAKASVPPELLPEPPEVLIDAPPADAEAPPQESQQEKDKEDAEAAATKGTAAEALPNNNETPPQKNK